MNILLIMTDQFRFDCLSSLGHSLVKTPNLDNLAENGVLFENAYCASMACGPARASIFTGKHSDSHKRRGNGRPMVPGDYPVIPEYLKDAGYQTALIGKLHLQPFERNFGFDHFLRHDAPYRVYDSREADQSAYIKYLQQTVYKESSVEEAIKIFDQDEASQHTDELRFMLGSNFLPEENHETAWVAKETSHYLSEVRDKNKPFFLNVSFFGPHQPYLCPPPWQDLYPPDDIPLPPDFYYEDNDKPILNNSPLAQWEKRRIKAGWDESTYRSILSAYYGYISMIDHYLGKIFDTLKAEDLWEETIIIFTSDHGEYGGQFKQFYKGMPYEGSTHIPFIMRHPQQNIKPGSRISSNISAIDVFATCLKSGGCPLPVDTESRDLSLFFDKRKTESESWDNRIFFKIKDESQTVRDRYKLMRALVGEKIVYEFYDLENDPMEANNEINNPDYANIISTLQLELDTWHTEQDRIGKQNV